MAILYTLNKIQDQFVVEVEQDSTFILAYTSDGSNNKVEEGELTIDIPHTLNVTIDGKYELTLKADGENDVVLTLNNIRNLQNSLILDAKVLLCDDCGCTTVTADCLSKAGKRCLKHKSVFVKMTSYQYIGLPSYNDDSLLVFSTFAANAVATYKCKSQTSINHIIMEECITGSVKDTETLFNFYFAIYWAGMYFTEVEAAKEDLDELEFIKTKYAYDTVVACLCSTCIDMELLKSIYEESVANKFTIHSFQFNGTEYDINDIDMLTDQYLAENGAVEYIPAFEEGKNFTYTKIGRIGFVIKRTFGYKFAFLDAFDIDITNITFDRFYDSVNRIEYFVSKESYIPSNIYLKLLKL